MRPALILVGASVRAAAQSAARAGFAPIAGDLFADVDTRACASATRIAPYPARLEAFLHQTPRAPWMYLGGLENEPDLVDRLANNRPLWGNRGETLRRVRNLEMLSELLARRRFAFPESRRSPEGLPRDGSWLHKAERSCGGRCIEPWTKDASESRPGWFWQRRLEGTPIGAAFAARDGKATFLGATRQLVGPGWGHASPLGYVGSVGPLALDETIQRELIRLGNALAEDFALVGLFGVDLILGSDRIAVLEVNPRYTASMEILERGLHLSMISIHALSCGAESGISQGVAQTAGRQKTAEHRRDEPRVFGKAVVFAEKQTVAPDALALLESASRDDDGWPRLADIPFAGEVLEPSQPIATVLAAGPSIDAVELELLQRATELRRLLA